MSIKSHLHFLHQDDEVLLILWCTTTVSRIFPVHVKAIEVVSQNKSNATINESLSLGGICCHNRVVYGSLIPSTYSKKCFETRIMLLQACEPIISTSAPIFTKLVPSVK